MTRDEIREITEIVGDDRLYKHFVRRINKEFEISDAQRNSNVYVLFQKHKGRKIGFSVIGHSPAKMKVWQKTFKEEGWVGDDFEMDDSPFELMYMYVQPKYRAGGYGIRLFERIITFTKKKKIGEIYAYVSDRNPAALKFYKKMNAEILQDFSDEEISSAFLRWII